MRESQQMANWINQLCPKIDIKEEKKINRNENSNQESLNIDIELINNKTLLTDKKEYIKQQFFAIKKQLNNIEKNLENEKPKARKRKHKRIRITFDFSFINTFLTITTLLIIYAFYKTGRKLLINAGQHKE